MMIKVFRDSFIPSSVSAVPLWLFLLGVLSLLLQAAHVCDQRLDLLGRQLLLERGHLALAVRDGVEDALVRHVRLPTGVGQVARVQVVFGLEGVGATVLAVTRGAVLTIGHGGV